MTIMSNKKGDGKDTFLRAVNNKQIKKDKTVNVPEMIKKEQPKPVLRPKGWDGLVDQELFDQKWNKQIQTYKPPEKAVKSKQKLNDIFDQISNQKNNRDPDRGRE